MATDQFNNNSTDRRSVPRFSPNPATACRVHGLGEASGQPATVHNISSNGIKIVVQQPVGVGMSLVLTLLSKTGPFPERTVNVRVARSSQQADGSYALGCAFQTQLNGHELLALAL